MKEKRRPLSIPARVLYLPPAPISEVLPEGGDGDSAIIMDFTVQPFVVRDGDFLGDREEAEARTFHIHSDAEQAYPDVPWRRMAEIISPFILRVFAEYFEDVRPGDIKPNYVLAKFSNVFGIAHYDKAGSEDEETLFAFHGVAQCLYVIKEGEARGMTTVHIMFFDGSDDGANFVFEERL